MSLVLLVALVKCIDGIMQRAGIEWLVGRYLDADSLAIGLFPPADVALGACFLRTDVGIKLLVGTLAVDAQTLAVTTVGIVLDGTAAVETAALHRIGHFHHHAEA